MPRVWLGFCAKSASPVHHFRAKSAPLGAPVVLFPGDSHRAWLSGRHLSTIYTPLCAPISTLRHHKTTAPASGEAHAPGSVKTLSVPLFARHAFRAAQRVHKTAGAILAQSFVVHLLHQTDF